VGGSICWIQKLEERFKRSLKLKVSLQTRSGFIVMAISQILIYIFMLKWVAIWRKCKFEEKFKYHKSYSLIRQV